MFAPAARVTDMHTCPMVTPATPPVPHVGGPILPPGDPMTLIAGLPAARVGDMCVCVGPPDVIVMGSFTVLIGGKPAARLGDTTAHGGVIVVGAPTVMIGDSGSGSGSAQGAAFTNARTEGKPFVETNCDRKAGAGTIASTPLTAEEDPKKLSWIEIVLRDDDGQPVPHERYRVVTPDGVTREGFLDSEGRKRISGIDPGSCKVTFPDLDKDAWDPA